MTVDLLKATWENGPRVNLADGYLTTTGNGSESINPAGPFGPIVLGVSLSSLKPQTATIAFQLQHRAGSGDSWEDVGDPIAFSAVGKQFVAIAGVLDRVRVHRTVTGSSPKFYAVAAITPAVGLNPQELDSGTAGPADIVAALVALGLAVDTA